MGAAMSRLKPLPHKAAGQAVEQGPRPSQRHGLLSCGSGFSRDRPPATDDPVRLAKAQTEE